MNVDPNVRRSGRARILVQIDHLFYGFHLQSGIHRISGLSMLFAIVWYNWTHTITIQHQPQPQPTPHTHQNLTSDAGWGLRGVQEAIVEKTMLWCCEARASAEPHENSPMQHFSEQYNAPPKKNRGCRTIG